MLTESLSPERVGQRPASSTNEGEEEEEKRVGGLGEK